MDLLWRARAFFQQDWSRIVGALGLLILNSALGLLKPWPLALLVDFLASGRVWSPLGQTTGDRYVVFLITALVLVSLAHALLSAWQQGVVISTGLRGLARVRKAVFEWLLGLSLRRVQGAQSGDLIFRATWDTYAFQTLFTQGVFVFLGAAVSVVAMTVVMGRMNLGLTGIAWATIPALLLVMRFFGGKLSGRSATAQAADATVASGVQQTVANLLLVQSFTRESTERTRFDQHVDASFQARWSQHRLEIVYLAVVAIVLALGTSAIVGFGVGRVEQGSLTVGELLVFLAYLTQLYEPLNQLSHLGATVSNARAGAIRVLELLEDVPSSGAEAGRESSLGPGPWGLELVGVGFGYTSERRVFRDLNLSVGPGEVVALIGPSGSGKTTLLQLIPRLLEPDQGEVRVGGRPVRTFRREELRKNISLVLQEPLLLPTTVAENIGYGREGATQEEIEAAARAANADGFIRKLPAGYHTVVGEGAARLSVGEKQRINLARAFLKNAPVLLLDEPTSALDSESEQAVMDGLRSLLKGRTVLMVAHRFATLREVNRIAVLNEGQIEEIGTPSDLLKQNGYFARLTQQS
ncbi:MAG: ABC transporter ATP-binding protein [Verrucomicrobia bacterium]|nr:ABC transporter ATP-binding protein [Verrucomicrobiota bacterium]